jgi:hypothetical protein
MRIRKKQELESLKEEISFLRAENERLVRELNMRGFNAAPASALMMQRAVAASQQISTNA